MLMIKGYETLPCILDSKEKSIEKDQHQNCLEMNDAQFVVNGQMAFTTTF